MNNPRVTVLMTVYNGSRFLRDSIRSILNQTFNNFEFIIVDDCSTDDSLKIIHSFVDSRIKVIRNPQNIGLTKSLNKGLKSAKGKYIARMDADDISLSDRLTLQYKYLEEHSDISLLGGGAHFIDENNKVTRTKLRLPDHDSILFYCFFNNPFIHSSVMFRRECLATVGLYDEYYKYAQDYELWTRWTDHYKVANLSQVIIKWRNSTTNITNTKRDKQARFGYKITLDFYRKHLSGIEHIEDKILIAIRDSKHTNLSEEDLLKANFVIDKMKHKFCHIVDARLFCENYPLIPNDFKKFKHLEESIEKKCLDNKPKCIKHKIKNFSLSVVVCTHSNVNFLKKIIPIVLDDPVVKQVIIVDNDSKDDTFYYLGAISNSKLEVVTNRDNKGVIKARNQGLVMANSEYTIVLDDDQIPSEYTFKRYKNALEIFDIAGYEGHIMNFITGLTVRGNTNHFTYVGAGGMCMKTELWKKLGLFDEIYSPCFFEDPDICIKAKKLGSTLGIVKNSGIEHVAHVTLNENRNDLWFKPGDICIRNRKIFLNKYGIKKQDLSTIMYKNISNVLQVLRMDNGDTVRVNPGTLISGNGVSYINSLSFFKKINAKGL